MTTSTPSRPWPFVGNPVGFRWRLRRLYDGRGKGSAAFLYGLLAIDLATIVFVIITSFVDRGPLVKTLDVLIGIFLLLEFSARLYATRRLGRELLHFGTWADLVAIGSFLAPLTGEGVGFLRIIRTLRLLRAYGMLARLRSDWRFFKQYEKIIFAAANLVIFIFVMTATVYETQHARNADIRNYADALYFTVTALTTTGFGDIVLKGTLGRMITVVIMIFGVTLFLNLARALFQPSKVHFVCPACGLSKHDIDAVHCKACGRLLNIPDEGAV